MNEATSAYQIILYHGWALPESYRPMIYSKWLRSLRYGNDYFKLIDQDAYFSAYHYYIEKLLSSKDCLIRLAVLGDDHDVVLGFSICRATALDYVHVHKDYRRTGIGSALVPLNIIDTITHITKPGMSFWNSMMPLAKFNPFA